MKHKHYKIKVQRCIGEWLLWFVLKNRKESPVTVTKDTNARVDLLNTYSHVPDLGPGQSSEVLQEGTVRLCLLFRKLPDHISQNVLHLFQAEAGTEGQP